MSQNRAVPDVTTELWRDESESTLSARITRSIRDDLFSGKLTPGAFLGTEANWAQQFGVSRMAARDAIRSLKAAGIIDIRIGARGGIFVAPANPDCFAEALAIQMKLIGVELEEVLDAQIAIEVTAAELAASRATPENIQNLRRLLDEMRKTIGSPKLFTEFAMFFREAVVAASNNRVLLAQFRGLRHLLLPHYTRHSTQDVARRVVASHEDLLRHIEGRDPVAARELMRQRLQTIRERQLMHMRATAKDS